MLSYYQGIKSFTLSLVFIVLASTGFAQELTVIKGKVIDAETKETLPFVNISFVGTSVGTTTDIDGSYIIESQWVTDTMVVSYVSYDTRKFVIQKGATQTIDVLLSTGAITLGAAVVTAEKGRYKKKGNPSVELMRKVIKNKGKNRLEGQDYFEYDKYEKIELSINNITEKFMNRKAFKKFQFIFDYVDTSEVNGKPYLPLFIRETASKVYFRKKPKTTREYRNGIKMSGIDKYLSDESISNVLDLLYQDVDIYENTIHMLDQQFISPLSSLIAVDFYRFYIRDTIEVNNRQVVIMDFTPQNKQNFGFKGNMHITLDSNYTVTKIDMGIDRDINVNFVKDLKIEQEFTQKGGAWILTKDELLIDYNLTKKGMGFFGNKTTLYTNQVFNTPRKDSIYEGSNKVIEDADAFDKTEDFWVDARPVKLTESEEGVYQMIDTLQNIKAFKNALEILSLLMTGYKAVGPVDIGPINSFYSFNPVEGFRLKLGGETNLKFDEKFQIKAYAAYGFNDKKFKYSGILSYSFNKDFREVYKHEIRGGYTHETTFPGQSLEFANEDNFLLSFKRGNNDRMIFYDKYELEYLREMRNNITVKVGAQKLDQRPIGSLTFPFFDGQENAFLPSINSTTLNAYVRYAPNQKVFQGRSYTVNLFNKYPILEFYFNMGLKDVLGGNYDYKRFDFKVFKRFYLSIFGTTNMEVTGGKIWGEVPYLLAHLPRANQSFAYQVNAFNMMNFMEFASDEYITVNMQHFFNGFFFNKIPLLRKLKLRELVTFKAIYGRLSDKNNPHITDTQVQFPLDDDGNVQTFTLTDEPYIEGSVGVSNIFKILRLDLIKRFNYLDNPNVPQLWGVKGLGIRFRAVARF